MKSKKINGTAIDSVLKELGIPRSTYYSWKKAQEELAPGTNQMSPKVPGILPLEEKIILDFHDRNPHLRHRQIQGMIQNNGHYISPSSVYKILKEHNRIDFFERPSSLLKAPRYEVVSKNLLWSSDWSKVLINWTRHHLLVVMDVFSRKVMGFKLVTQVNSEDIQELIDVILKKYNIENPP